MATLVSYALTTLADVKETLGIASSDSSWDNLIIRKINQSTEMIEGWCQRRFKETTYTDELYDATYDRQLQLRNYPVTSTATFALSARDTTLNQDSFDSVDTDQYFIDRNAGIIDAVSSFWGSFDQWKVTYSAGYATIPSDLQEACATLAAYLTVNDPSAHTGIESMREGSREIRYSDVTFGGANSDLFADLGILPTLQRYSVQPLGSGR